MTEKMKFETPNLTAENVAKIAQIFPGVVTEGKVNFDLLRTMLGDEVYGDEAYEFTWVGKRDAIAEAGRSIRKTLRPVVEDETTPTGADSTGKPYCSSGSKNWDTTENLYIEGDNLDVLKLLQESYLGNVKMIYIDPPYNTGNDFIYRDDFKQNRDEYEDEVGVYDEDGNRLFKNTETNGRFHSDWCSMMYPRLVLARNLLHDEGVVFISIDENEVSAMQQICNEVFGSANYAATFIWTKTSTPPALAYKCRKTVEYVLAYEKRWTPQKYFGSMLDNGDAPLLNTGNPLKTLTFPKGSVRFNFIKNGTITAGKKEKVTLENDILVENGVNATPFGLTGHFKWGQDTLENEVSTGTYFLIKTDKFSIRFQRVGNNDAYKTPTNFMNIELNTSVGVGTNESAVKEIESLQLGMCFSYPKPSTLIEALCSMVCKFDTEALVLDFFSGSATTAHAVMQLNAEDGGNRKFIMVQLPEVCAEGTEAAKAGYKNICEIGKERIRRAGEKIKAENADKEGIENLDIGFRVLKLDDTNMNDVYYAPDNYTQELLFKTEDNIKSDRTDMDLLYGCLLDWGLPLSMPHTHEKIDGFTVHTYNNGDLIACFEKNISEKAIREIASRKPLRAVFRDEGFISSPQKINVFEIFKLLAPNTSVKVI